jgi:hypothetical protein
MVTTLRIERMSHGSRDRQWRRRVDVKRRMRRHARRIERRRWKVLS